MAVHSGKDCPCRSSQLLKSIFTAAQDGDLDRVRSFFDCGLKNIDFSDDFGYTALHYAAQWNRIEVVKYLLQKGANADVNECGATPLHRAAYRGAFETCKLLVEHHADVNAQDTSFHDDRTPLHKAASQVD